MPLEKLQENEVGPEAIWQNTSVPEVEKLAMIGYCCPSEESPST